jgi:hypothetical protein
MNSHDPVLDHRARIERARLDAEERRAHALHEQCAPQNSPDARVRVWERLHQVRLPKDPAHAILRIIAHQTALDLNEVLEVQRQRALPAASAI